MYRKIWGTALTLITALGFAAATASSRWAPGQPLPTARPPLTRHTEGHAMHRPAKDRAARILVSLGASYFATLLLLIFQP